MNPEPMNFDPADFDPSDPHKGSGGFRARNEDEKLLFMRDKHHGSTIFGDPRALRRLARQLQDAAETGTGFVEIMHDATLDVGGPITHIGFSIVEDEIREQLLAQAIEKHHDAR